jgi:nucleoside-diphosphate-sugar epimerase
VSGSDLTGSILVVVGAGFVGGALVRRLLQRPPRRLIIVDNLLSADSGNVPEHPAVEFVRGSIADGEVLDGLPRRLDLVFHLACYHGNQSSIHDPLADHQNNALTTLKLLDHLKTSGSLEKVVYAAAGCAVAAKTFDQATATPEDAPVSLFHDTPYSVSKLIGEMYGNYYFLHYGLPFVKARFQNVYGPGEILGAGRWRGTPHTVWRKDFTGTTALRASDQAVDDNLASGVETSIIDLALLINELTGNSTPLDLAPTRDWDRSGRRFGAPHKARHELDLVAKTPLREGLERTIEWTRANRDTIRRCMLQHADFVPEVRDAVEWPTCAS